MQRNDFENNKRKTWHNTHCKTYSTVNQTYTCFYRVGKTNLHPSQFSIVQNFYRSCLVPSMRFCSSTSFTMLLYIEIGLKNRLFWKIAGLFNFLRTTWRTSNTHNIVGDKKTTWMWFLTKTNVSRHNDEPDIECHTLLNDVQCDGIHQTNAFAAIDVIRRRLCWIPWMSVCLACSADVFVLFITIVFIHTIFFFNFLDKFCMENLSKPKNCTTSDVKQKTNLETVHDQF